VLRYHKIITPVKCVIPLYDGSIVPPEEGELHRRLPITKKSTVEWDRLVWSLNIDKSKSLAAQRLQLLWDATDVLL
jgi:hypothetical protein